jgi:hypothetical protein
MKRSLSAWLLGIALIMPVAVRADRHDREKHARDVHEWNEREEKAYREYLKQQRREYREWAKANKKEQKAYWKWRRKHPDSATYR